MGAAACHVETCCGYDSSNKGQLVQYAETRHTSRLKDLYGTPGVQTAEFENSGHEVKAPTSILLKGPETGNSLVTNATISSDPAHLVVGQSDLSRGASRSRCRESAAEDKQGDETVATLAASYFVREDPELKLLTDYTFGPATRTRRRHHFNSGAIYDGQWLNNARDGLGQQTWPGGAKYIGEWKNNVVTGVGAFYHSDGDVYIGTWRDNLAHGLGTYNHRNGTVYRGQFYKDFQDGYGFEQWADGSEFIGNFSKGQKTGLGVYRWQDGSEYSGQWEANYINGRGTYRGSDGRHYSGSWKESTMHGPGCYTWVDGRCYQGQYVSDQKDGFGIFSWADGRRYEGYWSKGQQHGAGRLYSSSGYQRLAMWQFSERKQWLEEDASGVTSPSKPI